MPQITLPDGSKRQFDQAVSVMDVANFLTGLNVSSTKLFQ